MSLPLANKRLRKTYWHVGVRAAAVQGAHAAFPQLSVRELAAALGLTRFQVRHYLLGQIKSAFNRTPPWAAKFFAACRALNAGNTSTAAMALSQCAQLLSAQPSTKKGERL